MRNSLTVFCLLSSSLFSLSSGCTSESTKIAIKTTARVEDVQDTIVANYDNKLQYYMFQSLVSQVNGMKHPLTEEDINQLNTFWNERKELDFLSVQWERARCLRMLGIDSKLWSDQSELDLVVKQVQQMSKVINKEFNANAGSGK